MSGKLPDVNYIPTWQGRKMKLSALSEFLRELNLIIFLPSLKADKTRPDSPVPTLQGLCDPSQIRRIRSQERNPVVPASTCHEALFHCTKPSGVPRGPSQLHSDPDFSEARWEASWGHWHKSMEPRVSCSMLVPVWATVGASKRQSLPSMSPSLCWTKSEGRLEMLLSSECPSCVLQ